MKNNKLIILSLLCVFFLVILIGCFIGSFFTNNFLNYSNNNLEEKESTKIIEYEIKDICTLGDLIKRSNYDFIANSAKFFNSENEILKASENSQYVEFNITITNNSDKEIKISPYDFYAYVDNKYVSESVKGQIISNYSHMDGTLIPGTTLQGNLCYEIPINWSELDIVVKVDEENFLLVIKNSF